MAKEKIFVDGMYIDTITTNYGEITKQSYNVDKFKAWLDEHVNEKGFVNIDIKIARSGNKYAELSTYTPREETQTQDETPQTEPERKSFDDSENHSDDLPF